MNLWLLAACTPTPVGSDPPPSSEAAPYDDPSLWVCRPGLDTCTTDLDVLVVDADGTTTTLAHRAAASPELACFYVYPTASSDPTPNADRIDGGEESLITRSQAGPYSRVCDIWAPLYRQVSILGLFDPARDFELPYEDVRDAFAVFREEIGERPFLLIGHSQGTAHLTRLIAEDLEGDLEGDPQFVAAHLLGGFIEVPVGAEVGGSFSQTPLCTGDEAGCVVHWVSYDDPPPTDSTFGRASAGHEIACTDPVALFGTDTLSSNLLLHVPSGLGQSIGGAPGVLANGDNDHWSETFYRPSGRVQAACAHDGTHSWLAVDTEVNGPDARLHDLGGTLFLPGWGLHLYDIALASEDLVDLAARQHSSWQAR